MIMTDTVMGQHIEPCTTLVKVEGRLFALEADVIDVKADKQRWRDEHERRQDVSTRAIMDELKIIKDSLINRLPLWATLMFTTFMGVIGFLLGIIYFILRRV